jgi:hypothetical protein
MASRRAETAVFLWGDRNAPASVTVDAAKVSAASPGVDGFAKGAASLTRAIEICSIVKGVSAAV